MYSYLYIFLILPLKSIYCSAKQAIIRLFKKTFAKYCIFLYLTTTNFEVQYNYTTSRKFNQTVCIKAFVLLPWEEDQHAIGPDAVDNSVSHTACICEWVLVSKVKTLKKLCGLLLDMLGCLRVTEECYFKLYKNTFFPQMKRQIRYNPLSTANTLIYAVFCSFLHSLLQYCIFPKIFFTQMSLSGSFCLPGTLSKIYNTVGAPVKEPTYSVLVVDLLSQFLQLLVAG